VANKNLGEIYHLTGSSSADLARDETANTLVVATDHWIYLPLFTHSSCR
jgi:hypothetical protein